MNLAIKTYRYLLNNLKIRWNELKKIPKRKIEEQHQLTSTTWINRYSEIFSFTRDIFENTQPRILSFGCSTGEECFSIKNHFPESLVFGTDINSRNLNLARRSNTDESIDFFLSEKTLLKIKGPFDIIFAMSVLCRWEDTKGLDNCSEVYSFDKFDDMVKDLFSFLKPGGLFVVYNANFRVEDSSVAPFLTPIITEKITESGFVHKFDRQNNRILNNHKKVIYKRD